MEPIIVAILGSGALSALISGIFGLIQSRKSKQKEIEEDLKSIKAKLAIAEKDALRTQLMVMIKDYPQEKTDILRLSEHYFVKLEGNWIMSNIFQEWCEATDTSIPKWFREEK